MESTTHIIRPMKKIRVSGCANCPYMRMRSVKDGNYEANCLHPSFSDNPLCHTPPVSEYLDITKFRRTPDWCPLDNDNEAYIISEPLCHD